MKYGEDTSRSLEQAYMAPAIARQRERVVDALNLQTGARVLDVGSGPGMLAELLSARVGSTGHVRGIDTSEPMISIATARCSDCSNVEFRIGDIAAIEAEDATFDAVTCLQVLLYVEDIPEALAEMSRVLRPAGRVAIIETDWSTALLAGADLDVTRQVFAAWDAAVPSPALPRLLPAMLQNAGFTMRPVDAIPIVDTMREPGGFADLTLRSCAEIARERGYVSEVALQDWEASLDAALADGTYFFCVNRYLFVADCGA